MCSAVWFRPPSSSDLTNKKDSRFCGNPLHSVLHEALLLEGFFVVNVAKIAPFCDQCPLMIVPL